MSEKPVTVDDVVLELREHPGMTCTELGERLWRAKGRRRNVNRQSYARPAGKLVKKAIEMGLVTESLTTPVHGDISRRVFFAKKASK
ncbi:hypothetical protein KOR42_05940 [Thalassoglobus neptunius]|uniref:Uncharacterized protein n=1 Tax=Thalassoglobus neptunius TaxID=1938619 RepID=A0A5C5X2R5_9PLAN|nr:hypothetical protein KOR42_05940 [Thalassoglobus neptunius]